VRLKGNRQTRSGDRPGGDADIAGGARLARLLAVADIIEISAHDQAAAR